MSLEMVALVDQTLFANTSDWSVEAAIDLPQLMYHLRADYLAVVCIP